MVNRYPLRTLEAYASAVVAAQEVLGYDDTDAYGAFQRMSHCLDNYRARVSGNPILKSLRSHVHRRCRELLCPICQDERRKDLLAQVVRRCTDALRKDTNVQPLWMSIDGPPFPIHQAAHTVAQAVYQWQDFSYRKNFKSACSSYVRGLRLKLNQARDHAWVTTSLLLLRDRDYVFAKPDEWLLAWNASAAGPHSTIGDYKTLPVEGVKASDDVAVVVRRLTTLGTHATQLCDVTPEGIRCDPQRLQTVQLALKRRRLIYAGGLLRPLD